jgi:hypothetical protein
MIGCGERPQLERGDIVNQLSQLPDMWESTLATLHAYAKAIGAIPRAHAIAHPKWWHVSLAVRPSGLVTDPIPLPNGGALDLRMDVRSHAVVVETSTGDRASIPMNAGRSSTSLGDELVDLVAGFGLTGDVDRSTFEDEEDRSYDEGAARLIFAVFTDVATVFERHRASLPGNVGIVQLWPHGFDLAVEWFGTRTVEYEDDGAKAEYPSQLNLGFFPGGEPYFYSNPWPFEADRLIDVALPHGARWTQEAFEGTTLPYAALIGDPDWQQKLAAYARAVFEAAAPTLSAKGSDHAA